ncbi:synaptic vesicle transporter, partial [Aureobasidium melanogenum]
MTVFQVSEPAVSNRNARERVPNSSRHISRIRSLILPGTDLDDVDVCNDSSTGRGTTENPYIVEYTDHDRHDALDFSKGRKWAIAVLQSLSTFAVTFASSVYASGIPGVMQHFDVSNEVATLGLSLFVLGFALGPLIWAPLSEVYGRKYVADDFFSPFSGPIVGGFLGETQGWRWILGLVAILGGVVGIATALVTRETYAPFILRRRAKALSRMTGDVYMSHLDAAQPPKTLSQELSVSFTRPWILMFCEPLVLLTSLYISIIYGTLYMFFAGFPIVFQVTRGWSQGIAGLPFIGVAIGVFLAMLGAGVDSKRYERLCAEAEAEGRSVEPEARLGSAMVSSIVLPIVIGGMLFSCGLVMVFISLIGYLVDSYVIYAASVLATNSVLRSLFATAFPLFTTQMYDNLGDQWASSIPAFLALGCLPFPFLFHNKDAGDSASPPRRDDCR